jgi:catechol 2,3-dioxygenase-like lactoylglutathione lyase family enzyme
VEIEFLSTVALIAPDPPASRELYVDALGLPLESPEGAIVGVAFTPGLHG